MFINKSYYKTQILFFFSFLSFPGKINSNGGGGEAIDIEITGVYLTSLFTLLTIKMRINPHPHLTVNTSLQKVSFALNILTGTFIYIQESMRLYYLRS